MLKKELVCQIEVLERIARKNDDEVFSLRYEVKMLKDLLELSRRSDNHIEIMCNALQRVTDCTAHVVGDLERRLRNKEDRGII